jgi:multifunctional beta-oxidation protein
VTDGAAIVQTAIDVFNGVTILINNASILRDKGYVLTKMLTIGLNFDPILSFKNMSDQEWDQVIAVHLKGAFACSKAVWPHFCNQNFGRIINTASAAGLYGQYGLIHDLAIL